MPGSGEALEVTVDPSRNRIEGSADAAAAGVPRALP